MPNRNKAISKLKYGAKKSEQQGVSRRVFLKTSVGITLVGASITPVRLLAAESVPPEPDNLDEPTPWQEGDPEPVEMKVPAVEPEQQSEEAPPCQPMDDDRGDPPSSDHKWVYGYWWWTSGKYVWVPGYWEIPPKPDYEYKPGYWKHGSNPWIFVLGGWVVIGTTVIVASASPRPVLTAMVITAPLRIARRHRRWRHHHARRTRHLARTRSRRRSPSRGPSKGPSRGPSRGPSKGPGGPGRSPGRRR
jgi:hypothetical protein